MAQGQPQPFPRRADACWPPRFVPAEAANARVADATEKLRAGKSSRLLLRRAAAYLDLREYMKAEEDATSALDLGDEVSLALVRRAESRLFAKRLKEADADYREAMRNDDLFDEDWVRMLVGTAILRYGQERYVEAVRLLTAATMENRSQAADWYAILSAKWIEVHIEEERLNLLEVTRDTLHTPRNSRVYQERLDVTSWFAFGPQAMSLLDATMAAQLDRNNPWPLLCRAFLWDSVGTQADDAEEAKAFREQAIADYDHLLALRPRWRYVRQLRLDAWLVSGRYDRALLCAEEMLVDTPWQGNLLECAAGWRESLDLPEKHYGEPLTIWPPPLTPCEPTQRLAAQASRKIKRNPGAIAPLLERAEVRIDLGDHKGAWRDCSRVIALQPNAATGYLLRAELAMLGDCRGGDPKADFEKAFAVGFADKSERVRAIVGRSILDYEDHWMDAVNGLSAAADIEVALAAGHYARLSGRTTVALCQEWERVELARDIRSNSCDTSGYFMRMRHCRTGEFGQASLSLLDATMAIHIAPKNAWAWAERMRLWQLLSLEGYNYENAEMVRKCRQRALRDCDKVIEIQPEWRHPRFVRIGLLVQLSDTRSALREVEVLLNGSPDDQHLLRLKEELGMSIKRGHP